MDTTQLKMMIDAINSLGGSAQAAFYLWVIVNNLSGILIAVTIVGGILMLAKMILRAVRQADHNEEERLIGMIRQHLGFASYEAAEMVAHIVNNTKSRNP